MVTEADHRLPRTAVPSSYVITLEPDLAAATFAGEVVVDLDVVDPTDRLVLNAAELRIDRAELVDGDEPVRGTVTLDAGREQATVAFDDVIDPGRHRLRLAFAGVLNDQLRGFYRSPPSPTTSGVEQVLATTQFEATDARRAFPCWDEPDLKADLRHHAGRRRRARRRLQRAEVVSEHRPATAGAASGSPTP